MEKIKIKGHDIEVIKITDAFSRRSALFKNNIISNLKKLGVNDDQTDIELEVFASKNAPATAIWFMDGHRLQYTYKLAPKFAENMYYVSKVIENEVKLVLENKKGIMDFINEFTEDKDVEEKRRKARETLGIEEGSLDLEEIDKKFKQLSRKHHPDMEGGDAETFKKINEAHKTLRRELQ